ncbi:MAG: hypothetical protein NXI15_07205 [Gammaproteobacteria bacterium]|jgi:hypothetical protein|nr:hypothetical protein [Gammaproteobacteria bacterium]
MTEHNHRFSIDWRVTLGLVVTLIWITTGLIYLLGIVGWGNFVHLPTADIGSFLEGAFAPLAFLWLVIGHFMQQKEISANTRAIKLQEKSARRLELHSRQDSYFKLLTLVQEQLGGIAAFHYMSYAGPTGTGEMTGDEFTEQRAISSTGDHAWFVRKMIAAIITHREEPEVVNDILFGTDIRIRHTNNYATTFEKLLKAAQSVDPEEMITDALLNGSAHGLYYRIISYARGDEGAEPFPGAIPIAR